MHREANSHKGENGKVAVIGGSRFMHGAPIFSALAAEATGVDLIFPVISAMHENVTKVASYNFIVQPFIDDDIMPDDTELILELLATMDCAVIGPGVDHGNDDSISALLEIIDSASCPLVIDATALHPKTPSLISGKTVVLTPHLGELERMGLTPDALGDLDCVSILKGQTDIVTGPGGKREEIVGGNAGLTVGGTGDALTGIIAGLIAQRVDPYEATVMAATIMKRAGTQLFHDKGYAYTTTDIVALIPHLLHTIEL